MTSLNSELSEAVRDAGDSPVRVVDPVTNQAYVLVREDAFERLRVAAADDWHPRDMQAEMARVMSDDWNDQAMDSYDHP